MKSTNVRPLILHEMSVSRYVLTACGCTLAWSSDPNALIDLAIECEQSPDPDLDAFELLGPSGLLGIVAGGQFIPASTSIGDA